MRISEKYQTSSINTWVIGDSIKSEINPALNVGMKAILFKYRHSEYIWEQEYGSISIDSFYMVESLPEIIDIIKNPSIFEKKNSVD